MKHNFTQASSFATICGGLLNVKTTVPRVSTPVVDAQT